MNILESVRSLNIENVSNIRGKTILLRVDVNTNLGVNGIVDENEAWRIKQSFQTINFLKESGAKIIIIAHIGRNPQESLEPVFDYMSSFFDLDFVSNFNEDGVTVCSQMQEGDIVLMENVRKFEQEMENDISYLLPIIEISDMYVNDAFSVSHRQHASVSSITKTLPSYFGLQFIDEVEHLSHFLSDNQDSKILVLGGAKFGTKLSLLEKLLPSVDYVLLGGALANVLLKERGFSIGHSFYENIDVSHIAHNQKIILPIDYIDQHGDVADIYDVGDEDSILDIGPATLEIFKPIINHAGMVMWNGPMGKYEDGYSEGSLSIADMIALSDSFSLIGGGDTSNILTDHEHIDDFDFISTGGGAMLDFLVDGTLPGIDILINSYK